MKKSNPKKIIVILGPTASGKSDVAIKLAKKFDGEVISADSRQIYRGMDIGSGKVVQDTRYKMQDARYLSDKIRHHLIDVANPNDDFNISHFKKLAEKATTDILKRGKLPIVCGGTGFWIQSIVNNINLPDVKPDINLRKKLEKESTEKLFTMLKKLDTERASNIDAKNKVRLIRAIEIAKTLGKVPTQSSLIGNQSSNNYEFLQIGIDISREILNEKIKKRLNHRLEIGMIEEIEKLHNEKISWERLESFGLEYRWIAKYLQKKISLAEMRERLYFDIIHYAKRQMTWFQKDQRILWLKDYTEIEKIIKIFLDQK
jgi:tRNA dimethylallyltransferase